MAFSPQISRRGDLPCGTGLKHHHDLISSANELALIGSASPLLESRPGGTWGNRG
jgi:hypothetical protein